ncbi:hypothetical protein [Nonomuraea guangzhouensis]|uniref:Uncharacterized protein n=1 Tax=Nonomuraea guangzhouensis TaxID=1291555 RepID=A0ABW4GK42_9ACTN|nr:hypothetical protein [Nonomuraea guangzhouensis]
MRQKAARFGVTLMMAGTLAVGALAAATPASATASGWAPYQGFRTLTNCVKAGTAKLVMENYKEYDCRWDSPFYMLWLRK